MKTRTNFGVGILVIFVILVGCSGQEPRETGEATPSPVAAAAPTVEARSTLTPMAAASSPTAEPTITPTPEKVPVTSEATLPTLSLRYKGKTFEGYRFRGCWQEDDESGTECVDRTPRDVVDTYIQVDPGDTIAIQIDPDSRPTELLASYFTEPGELMVDDLLRLSPDERELVIDETPGRYNLRINSQWFEGGATSDHKVGYVFGLSIPGDVELRYGCGQTLEGGDVSIILDSLEDRDRTAPDAVNGGWCTFNKRIAQVRLILEGDVAQPYVETFVVQPPSETFHLPLPDEFESENSGGPIPQGEYLRRIVAVAVDGSEELLLIGSTDLVTLGKGVRDDDLPIIFRQHEEASPSPVATTSGHIKGFLQLDERCMHIRNSVIVWPSDFRMSNDGDPIMVLNGNDSVVARGGEYAELRGRRSEPNDDLGRQIRRTLPHNCPVDSFWIVAD